jgi:hypothetical protein
MMNRPVHAAVRRWALGEFESGRVTTAALRSGVPATRTLGKRHPEHQERHVTTVHVDILPDGVENLRRAGWLDGRTDIDSIGDAVVSLFNKLSERGCSYEQTGREKRERGAREPAERLTLALQRRRSCYHSGKKAKPARLSMYNPQNQ